MHQENPSWLYPVTMGATTIWERWDSMLPDGSINPGEMTSFNHYALGAVADWMHRTIGGIAPAEAGYRRIRIAPRPSAGLTHAEARHLTPYGIAELNWKIESDQFHLDVIIPPNTTAEVILPGSDTPIEIGSGKWRWSARYQDPDARGAFTVDDLVGDIIYDVNARDILKDTLLQVGAPGFIIGMLLNERNSQLCTELLMLPNHEETVKLLNEAFANL